MMIIICIKILEVVNKSLIIWNYIETIKSCKFVLNILKFCDTYNDI